MPGAPSADAVLALALRHVNAGQPERALLLCEHAATTQAPHPGVLQLMALLNLQRGQPEAACALAEASLALRPAHVPTMTLCADAWFQRALQCQDRRELDAAVDALARAGALSPGRAEVHLNLGIVLQERGEVEAALREYARAYALREDSFGRIAHALAAPSSGRLWLQLDELRAALRAAA